MVAQGSITMTVDTASKWMKALKKQEDKSKFLLQFADSAKISVERRINKEEPFRADQTVGFGYCLYASALRARMYATGSATGNYQTVEEEIAAVKQFAKAHWVTFEAKLTERKYETETIERWRKEIQDMVKSFGTHHPYPPSDLMQEWDSHIHKAIWTSVDNKKEKLHITTGSKNTDKFTCKEILGALSTDTAQIRHYKEHFHYVGQTRDLNHQYKAEELLQQLANETWAATRNLMHE
jgi:hypothetical protein